MFQRLFFSTMLVFTTIYCSWRQMMVDMDNCTPEEADRWGVAWGKCAVKMGGLKIEADMGDIDPNGHYVFIGNHLSNLDIPVLFNQLPKNRIRFVAKHSLFKLPIYGKALAQSGHICVDRENRRAAMKSLNDAVEKAKAGISPVIFPEGTRNKNPEELMEFKTGAMIIALKSGLPVVPIVVANTNKVMRPGKCTIENRQIIRFKALPVIDPSKYSIKEREQFKDDLYEMMSKEYKALLAKG